MSSHPETHTSGNSLLLCLASLLLPLILSSLGGAEGASFRDHRLRGSESEPLREPSYRSPDEDMLKALQHIDNLRRRTGGAVPLRLQKPPLAPERDAGLPDNAQALRAMLTLAAPERSRAGAEDEARRGGQRQGGAEGEEEWEGEDDHEQSDKTQEWFQAVLRALEQTEPAKGAPRSAGERGGGLRLGERAVASPEATRLEGGEEAGKDEEQRDEEEEEEEGGERGVPFVRRTGEGVGEKYTPQKLATLQSIFDEVERMADGGGGKEEEEEGEEEEGGHEKEGLSARSLAYNNVARGLADWAPLQQGEEEEEGGDDEEAEQRGNKRQADQVLDYSDDGEEEDDAAEEGKDEEQDGESLSAKRSANGHPADDTDDMANLVDYYLLKVLEKTEEEDKRELEKEEEEEEEEEEKERAERKVSQFQYWDNRAPQQDMQQLIRLSQKYQVPPEDLLAMLKAGDRSGPRSRTKPYKSSGFATLQTTVPQKQQGLLGSKLYNRYRTPHRQSSYKPKDARTQEILNILGLGSVGGQDPAALTRPQQYKVSQSRFQPRRKEKYAPSQIRVAPNKLKDDYDSVGEDELAAYLAAKILAQYPAPAYNRKTGQKRSAYEDEDQGTLGSFEQAMQDYFDHMDSDRVTQQQKRQSETEDSQTHMDDDALMKIMSFLKPEGETSDDN
ncbi:hypothetical protein NHX12_008496 [Muraenolepis orangiensis]|uniref:Secretogranin II n=1 Tax=Muraenolepis orangiensis TaxID=630683 RepID=A0A9Q0IBB3_9TELE|nr:hypothetical protein NHX12_008496 [Muraenolepis orangiensis]